ncbi:hypothetical protein B0H10DRAFT_2070377 [Mycena sp. CBHHK59/15]|nr:hypothetical protein B0H10DRAFT_2070377 [Mycena sp. CBHHK59/15]
MSRPFESLPQPLLDEIVTTALKLVPSLRGPFLSSLGSCLHASAVRVLFRTITLQDDARVFTSEDSSLQAGAAYPVLYNPNRYASMVKTLVIVHPDLPHEGSQLQDELAPPIDADLLVRLLEICANMEELVWESSFPPPDGLCEMLATHTPRLLRFAFAPPVLYPSPPRCSPAKWDAPSVPLLSSISLTSLRLCRLSQAGARSFSALLSNLGDESSLENLNIDFVWLDDPLCAKVVEAGRKMRRLTITTSGTKLTDKGVVAILEGCDALEELVLDEVQGRLSRTLWTKPASYPAALKTLRIVIAETGPHHSWATDHLDSLHAIPLGSLSSLDVVRREAPPSLHNGVPMYDGVVDETVALKSVPTVFMDGIKEQKTQMESFRCDFWSFSIADIKLFLDCSPKLEHTQICLDAPFSKLISLTSTFASLSNLHTLSVCVTPVHAPGKPPVPILPLSKFTTSLPTPTDSPVLKAKSVLPQLLDIDQMQTQTCHPDCPGDPSMPLLRDIKRFVRKCPRLEMLEWYGKAGRGSWFITRPATSSKISINVSVEYIAPKVSPAGWKAILREKSVEDGIKLGWGGFVEVERPGQSWVGEIADALAAERMTEKEESLSSPIERTSKGRESGKRVRVPSVSISSSSGSDVLLPSTPKTTSPIQHTPLTPPLSDYSMSEADPGWHKDVQSNPKRSPSEPVSRNLGISKPRTRSATAASNTRETPVDRSGAQPVPSSTAGRGGKHVRGRSGSSTRGTRKPAGNGGELSSGRGRGSRGSKMYSPETPIRPKRSSATA